jgi:hypothetical protein
MTQTIRKMRRPIGATLILTATLTILPAFAVPHRAEAYTYTPKRICDIDWDKGRRHVKKLIRCAAHHWDVRARRALYVARRESDFRPRAFNRSTCAKGVYQHLCRYWKERAYRFGFKGKSAFNGRANIIVTMKMVRRYGWSPWGL